MILTITILAIACLVACYLYIIVQPYRHDKKISQASDKEAGKNIKADASSRNIDQGCPFDEDLFRNIR